MAGRKPKPTKLRVLEGSRSHETKAQKAVRAAEPEPTAEIGRMPRGMPARAVRKWKEFVHGWETVPGLLTTIDNGSLEAACRAYAQAVKIDEEVDRLLRLISQGKAAKGDVYQLSIANAVSKKCWTQYAKFALEFGGSPASRVRLQGFADGDPGSSKKHKGMSSLEAALCG